MSEVSSGLPFNFRKLIPVTSDGVKLSTSGNTPDCTNVLICTIRYFCTCSSCRFGFPCSWEAGIVIAQLLLFPVIVYDLLLIYHRQCIVVCRYIKLSLLLSTQVWLLLVCIYRSVFTWHILCLHITIWCRNVVFLLPTAIDFMPF